MRIRRFNESLSKNEIESIVREYFLDILEDDNIASDIYIDRVTILSVLIYDDEHKSIEKIIKNYKENLNILKDINIGLKRLNQEYPNIEYNIVKHTYDDQSEIQIHFYEVSESGDFYKILNKTTINNKEVLEIQLNHRKMLELLGFNAFVSSPNGYSIRIGFRNYSHKQENRDKTTVEYINSKLKINNIGLIVNQIRGSENLITFGLNKLFFIVGFK